MDNKNIFAKNLNYYMAVNGKSRREICEALGFSYYTFTDWVKGRKYPRMDKVEMLANYFGILKSDLIEEKKKSATDNDSGMSDSKMKLIALAENCSEAEAEKLLQMMKLFLNK